MTLMRFDSAQAAVLVVEALFDSIKRVRGNKAPCASKTFLNSSPSPATFPKAHAHCSATGTELFSTRYSQVSEKLLDGTNKQEVVLLPTNKEEVTSLYGPIIPLLRLCDEITGTSMTFSYRDGIPLSLKFKIG